MRMLTSGRLEMVLSALLAAIAIFVGWRTGNAVALARDLVACLAAGCVVRWPRSATIALGAVLLTFLLSPREWVTFAEYAALIPVLSAGIRGERRRRTISSAAYLVLLTALQYHDYPGDLLFLYGGLVWTVLFAVMWLIGDVFTAYRKAQQDAAQLALAQQRIALARDLHDTIMRSLTRLSLRVQLAEAEPDPTVLPSVAEALHQTATELRWMLTLLRDGDAAELGRSQTDSLSALLREMAASLERRGFTVTVTAEGDMANVPESVTRVLGPVIGESEANIERHAKPGSPCAAIVSLSESELDMVFISTVGETTPQRKGSALGLIGAQERLAPIGGELSARQEGAQWVTRIVVPVPAMTRSG